MELTEERADELVRDVWTWLADNPGAEKKEWPRFSDISYMLFECPWCELYRDKSSNEIEGCGACPLVSAGKCCLSCYSPLYVWVGSVRRCEPECEGQKAASEIAQVAIDRLERNEYGK